jgi:hypothetical protein
MKLFKTVKFPSFSINFKRIEVEVPRYELNLPDWAIYLIASILSGAALAIFFKLNLIVSYNDARAHLNMARLVVDNLTPGLVQIGSVWLPLNHLLTLTLVWNDTLWQTGLAGAIYSSIAYVFTTAVIYFLIKATMKSASIALIGALVFATNLNILYMQSTPMTELLLLLFFTSSTYFLFKWSESKKIVDLLLAAGSAFLATLTRYDAWFLFFVMIGAIVFVLWNDESLRNANLSLLQKLLRSRSKIEGILILFSTFAGFGVFLWIIYNWAIFHDPFYFAFGPFSAHAQQAALEVAGSLPTKHNIILSLTAYWWAMVNNAGLLVLLFSIVGFLAFAYKYKLSSRAVVLYTLLTPFIFHVLALYQGHSILVLPELGVKITKDANGSWFNVRYGLMIMPAVAYCAAYLAEKTNLTKLILIGLLVLQPIIFLNTKNIITITDGVIGTSALDVADVSDWLVQNAQNKDGLILTSISYHNALAFSTAFPLKRIIHEGTGRYWNTSLVQPQRYAHWIVMANGDVGDPVYTALIREGNSNFLKYYDLKEKFKHINVYERRSIPPGFVYVAKGDFQINGKEFRYVGVNSYDLLYRSPEEINQTLFSAKEAGIEVVRFWGFGNGFSTAPQPSAGKYDETRLRNLDLIISTANQLDMKLIIVLSNFWEDYGGVRWYLEAAGLPGGSPQALDQFFVASGSRELYKKYITKVITRKSTMDDEAYTKEPSIFAWELMNEPRSATSATGSLVTNWSRDMAEYIRSIDENHMILTGTEGFMQDSIYTSTHAGPWFNEASDINTIAATTAHFYKNSNFTLTEDFRYPILSQWKAMADTFNKPLILEEIGFYKNKRQNDGVTREVLFKNLFDEARGHGVAGIMLWNWALKTDDSFGISPLDPGDEVLIKLIKDYSVSIQSK